MVTLEDVLEEIVGEIYDPDVEPTNPRHNDGSDEITELDDGRFTMKATTSIDDVNLAFGVELPDGSYNSIGGFLADVSDRIPNEGDAVMVRTSKMVLQFIAAEVDLRKVVRIEANRELLASKSPDGSASTGESQEAASDYEGDLARVVEVKVLALTDVGNGTEQDGQGTAAAQPQASSAALATPAPTARLAPVAAEVALADTNEATSQAAKTAQDAVAKTASGTPGAAKDVAAEASSQALDAREAS